jgi:diacylglycerol kinase
VKRLFSATINSLRGLGYGFKSEAALREEMILLAAGLSFWASLSRRALLGTS